MRIRTALRDQEIRYVNCNPIGLQREGGLGVDEQGNIGVWEYTTLKTQNRSDVERVFKYERIVAAGRCLERAIHDIPTPELAEDDVLPFHTR